MKCGVQSILYKQNRIIRKIVKDFYSTKLFVTFNFKNERTFQNEGNNIFYLFTLQCILISLIASA